MRHLIPDLSTDALLRVAVALEGRIIEGTARADDVDTYVYVQWELAERLDLPDAPTGPRRGERGA
jgi:hypothetical protein